MKSITVFTILIWLLSFDAIALTDKEYLSHMMNIAKESAPTKRLKLIRNLLEITNENESFYTLPRAAKTAFRAKDYKAANEYANRLLKIASKYKGNWNYGNAIHDGNLVLGRLAVKSGDIEAAKNYLIKAGKTPGSPQLGSFGPNFSLAKDLTDLGENEAVIKYFNLCKLFWKHDDGRLESWIASIKGGGKPYYGMNLYH